MLGRKDGELEYSRWVIRMNNEIFNFGQQTPARQRQGPISTTDCHILCETKSEIP